MRATTLIVLLLSVLTTTACSHGRGHRGGDPHGPRDIETYIRRLESPDRVAVLQVERVLKTLDLKASDTVADIGCGPGVFAVPLGKVLSSGLVYAVDVEPRQLVALRARAQAASLLNVVPVLGGFHDPFLPAARVDLVLLVDTYHHIEARESYFERLRGVFRNGGRLAIVEWKPGALRMGPPAKHKLTVGERAAELRAAGYERTQAFDFLELHDFEIWEPAR